MTRTIDTETDRAARARIVTDAEHSGEMEGLRVDEATREDAASYVAGQIDSHELVARTRARYGLT
jgi:hypothetical protein